MHDVSVHKSIKQDNWFDKKFFQAQWFGNNFGRKTYDQYMKLPFYKREQIFRKLYNMPLCFPDVRIEDRSYYLTHSCPVKIDNETVPCVNNCTDEEMENSVWGRYVMPVEGKAVIHGHTICTDERIHYDEGVINIDCGAAADWTLSCVRLDDLKEYYIRLGHSKFGLL